MGQSQFWKEQTTKQTAGSFFLTEKVKDGIHLVKKGRKNGTVFEGRHIDEYGQILSYPEFALMTLSRRSKKGLKIAVSTLTSYLR